MDVLVIGGSVFVGRAVVDEALAAGARVSVLNRGLAATAPPGVEQLRADRGVPHELERALRGRRFDLVVDTCGYVPVDVRASAELLAASVGHYAFVSSVNVFPGWPEHADPRTGGVHDGDPDAGRDDVPDTLPPGGSYGWLKVGCERAVVRALGEDRCSVLRAGAIVGPHDARVGRLAWWTDRFARGGEVLVPGAPTDPVSLLDARDLARFALSGVPGTFEVAGPPGRDTRADLVAALLAASADEPGRAAVPVWVEDAWLNAQGVEAWTELPLWAPRADAPGLFAHDTAPAVAAGLVNRPLAGTVADTRAWQRRLTDWRPTAQTPGLAPEREDALLRAWHRRGRPTSPRSP